MKKIGFLLLYLVFWTTGFAQTKARTFFDDADFRIEPLNSINTVGSDISPTIINGNLFFAAVREEYFNKKARERKNMAFYDSYSVPLDQDGKVTLQRTLVSGFGNKFHEGPVAFCAATNELFTTLSNTIDPDSVRKMFPVQHIRLRLAIKKMVDGEWKTIEELPFNNDKFHFAHPAISQTGDSLVFSSDKDSTGFGNADLYMSVRSKGKWGWPVNLGDSINTPGNEMFPTFLPGGLLSFASDGRPGGHGKLDIWYTSFPQTGPVKNAGAKINTYHDDFGLVIHPNQKVGYFASDRPGKGSDDIYRLDIIKAYEIFRGRVIDDLTLQPLANASVRLTDCSNVLLYNILTDEMGNFEVEVPKGACAITEASKDWYEPDKSDITGKNSVVLRLKQKRSYELVVLDVDNQLPVDRASVVCGSETPWLTNALGIAHWSPADGFNCILRITKDGYLDQTKVLDASGLKSLVTRDTVWLYKKEMNKTFVLKNIYYDYDKWNILPESEVELDKLIKIMNDNPNLRVELGSHTDARGSDEYNRVLSQKRSDSAVGYIVGKNIPKSRIVAKGYGETVLVNKCANGIRCTDQEHRLNRRTEFKIIGF